MQPLAPRHYCVRLGAYLSEECTSAALVREADALSCFDELLALGCVENALELQVTHVCSLDAK